MYEVQELIHTDPRVVMFVDCLAGELATAVLTQRGILAFIVLNGEALPQVDVEIEQLGQDGIF